MGTNNTNGNGKAGPGDIWPHLTPTQRRIMDVLADGKAHSVVELKQCLTDDLAGETAVKYHISMIRRKLRPVGTDISHHRLDGSVYYSAVRLMASPYRG